MNVIRYWDYVLGDWADIAAGTLGEDYTLSYITTPDDDLLGYTVLTVLEVALLDGDANRDGRVSAGDYAAVQMNFGNTLPSAETTTITPEPATFSLLVIAGVAMIRRRRK